MFAAPGGFRGIHLMCVESLDTDALQSLLKGSGERRAQCGKAGRTGWKRFHMGNPVGPFAGSFQVLQKAFEASGGG
jgi:hypothetical protein